MPPTTPDDRAPPFELRRGTALLRIDALDTHLLRIRIAPNGRLPEDASWVVDSSVRTKCAASVRRETAGLTTDDLRVRVDPATWAFEVTGPEGRLLLASAAGTAVPLDSAGASLRLVMPAGERYLALGDKTGPLDRRGRRFTNWTTDQSVTPETDPLYKAVPFVIGAGGAGGCWGLLLDDCRRTRFDFGTAEADVLRLDTERDMLDLYLVAGASVKEVVRRSAVVLGRPPLPPKWAFGYQQSRWSYNSGAELRAVVQRLREGGFPTDVVWLDIGFQDRNRPFTVDPERFADFPALVADLRAQAVHTVAITDLHVAALPEADYAPYESGLEIDAFLRNPDGSLFVGPVWPGPAVFPDFCRADVQRWWGGLYADLCAAGIAGFWVDMNEPCVFDRPGKTIPLDVGQRIATPGFTDRTATHGEVHNLTGLLNSRATYEGLERLRPDERPFVMTRSTFAGGQRWAVTWTGDNDATWRQLKLGVAQTLNLGLSGFAFTAVDVGGFLGEPTPELLTRWFQVQAFMPLMRNHTADTTPPQEPWVHGPEHEALRRKAVEERYRLAPYLYALADEAHRTGAPMVRPLFWDEPAMLDGPVDTSMVFLLGDSLLVAGSPTPDTPAPYRVPLPPGRWFDYWSGTELDPDTSVGIRTVVEVPRLDRLPVYVRDGTILPRQASTRALSEAPQGPLGLDIWPGTGCRATLYDDDGVTKGYERGAFLRQGLTCRRDGEAVALDWSARDGSWQPPWRDLRIIVHGWQAEEAWATGSGFGRIDATVDPIHNTATLLVPAPVGQASLRIAPR